MTKSYIEIWNDYKDHCLVSHDFAYKYSNPPPKAKELMDMHTESYKKIMDDLKMWQMPTKKKIDVRRGFDAYRKLANKYCKYRYKLKDEDKLNVLHHHLGNVDMLMYRLIGSSSYQELSSQSKSTP
jgi:hypothetical protein